MHDELPSTDTDCVLDSATSVRASQEVGPFMKTSKTTGVTEGDFHDHLESHVTCD